MRLPLHFPTRVSRLYPLLALALALNSSVLLYAWQADRIKLESYASFDAREQSLRNQISDLQSSNRANSDKLELENQKVANATAQLQALQASLTDKSSQLTAAQAQLKSQQDQLSQNASELSTLRSRPPLFSFQNQSSQTNVASQEADARALVTSAYDYIQQIYGAPYLLNSIVITFVNSFAIAGSSGEIEIENSSKGITIDIHLKSFDKNSFQDINTLIHEIIHGFHGVAVFKSSIIEEGETVAATDAVMQKMMDDGKIPRFDQLYIDIDKPQYDAWNAVLPVPKDNQAFYSNPQVSEIYQMIGYAWYQIYLSDPSAFKDINAAYYAKVQRGITPDTAVALDAIRSSVKTVDGQPINAYLAANRAFNPS